MWRHRPERRKHGSQAAIISLTRHSLSCNSASVCRVLHRTHCRWGLEGSRKGCVIRKRKPCSCHQRTRKPCPAKGPSFASGHGPKGSSTVSILRTQPKLGKICLLREPPCSQGQVSYAHHSSMWWELPLSQALSPVRKVNFDWMKNHQMERFNLRCPSQLSCLPSEPVASAHECTGAAYLGSAYRNAGSFRSPLWSSTTGGKCLWTLNFHGTS